MSISHDTKRQVFHLQTAGSSYVIRISRDQYLSHVYWGPRIRSWNGSNALRPIDRAFSANPFPDDRGFSLDTLPQEYPGFGRSDFRAPAFQVRLADGSTAIDLLYQDFQILKGKAHLPGLPACWAEAESEVDTLEITLVDPVSHLKAILSYAVWKDRDVICRSVRFANEGPQAMTILRAMSMNVDIEGCDFELLQLSGAHCRERHPYRRPLVPGIQSIESRRGGSSHQQNPFIALLSPDCTETTGQVFGFSLVYSGNFLAQVEVDQFDVSRISLGINPFDFSWRLDAGASFQTPEVVMVRSDKGLGDLSGTFHRLYRERLCRGQYRDRQRPILANSWEATYFNFTEKKILDLAIEAKELGIELLVLDDGWFGHRDSDTVSLGDWVVDLRKLPSGLSGLAKKITAMGLEFGLWFEPEMVSVDSDLYRAHPDWCLHVPGRKRTEGRSQLVLDLSRSDVRAYLVTAVSTILESAPISYVKWDMNRHLTEVGSPVLAADQQQETAHRHILGLYEILETLTSNFPEVLFEGCSGGGGRFDPGMLYYMPQTWTSDNTDALSRQAIQHGTSIVYPPITMGSHVSAIPNHQVGRSTPLTTRGTVAMSANFGYELDLCALSEMEKSEIRRQVAWYKTHRKLIQFGDFIRLVDPLQTGTTAWMTIHPDKSEALVWYIRNQADANAPDTILRLRGLEADKDYELSVGAESAQRYGGDELMSVGLRLPHLFGDYQSLILHLKAMD